jgi:hypothetical protein
MRCKAKIGSKAERTRQYVSISNRFSTPQRAARDFFSLLTAEPIAASVMVAADLITTTRMQ